MPIAYAILAASSAIGIAHSVFLAAYLLQLRKNNILANQLLALLLLAFALRVSKSVIHFAFSTTPDLFPAIALAGQSALGPLLWLYARSLLNNNIKLKPIDYLHFIPFAILTITIPTGSDTFLNTAYQLIVAQMLVYLMYSAVFVNRQMRTGQGNLGHWVRNLLGSGLLIWLVYLAQLFSPPISWYAGLTFFAAMVLYGLSFWAIRHYQSFANGFAPVKKVPLETQEAEQLYQNIHRLLEKEAIYKDAGLTVAKFAKRLHVQPYLLSKVINDKFGKSFPELLNAYRIQEVSRQLTDPKSSDLTIQTIAYNCGFNTISSFYTAFKLEHNVTPAQYRSQMLEVKQ